MEWIMLLKKTIELELETEWLNKSKTSGFSGPKSMQTGGEKDCDQPTPIYGPGDAFGCRFCHFTDDTWLNINLHEIEQHLDQGYLRLFVYYYSFICVFFIYYYYSFICVYMGWLWLSTLLAYVVLVKRLEFITIFRLFIVLLYSLYSRIFIFI